MTDKDLLAKAKEAREMAYAPYSRYKVGAALLAESGKVYLGCNVENASYGACNCGERTAVFKAVSQGERQFTAIAIVGGKAGEKLDTMCTPCGICRQVLREFAAPEKFRIILTGDEENTVSFTLEELLPRSFGPANLA